MREYCKTMRILRLFYTPFKIGLVLTMKLGLVPTMKIGLVPTMKIGLVPTMKIGLVPTIKIGLVPTIWFVDTAARRKRLVFYKIALQNKSCTYNLYTESANFLVAARNEVSAFRRTHLYTLYTPWPVKKRASDHTFLNLGFASPDNYL